MTSMSDPSIAQEPIAFRWIWFASPVNGLGKVKIVAQGALVLGISLASPATRVTEAS